MAAAVFKRGVGAQDQPQQRQATGQEPRAMGLCHLRSFLFALKNERFQVASMTQISFPAGTHCVARLRGREAESAGGRD